MTQITHTHGVATMSWIDPRIGLPEDDRAGDPGPHATRSLIMGNQAYRFANFLEAFIVVENGSIVGHGLTGAAGIYRAPSFGRLPSEYYAPVRNVAFGQGYVRFYQTVGARTQSPEVIGESLGGPVGRALAHAAQGFPPIWTALELTIHADGTFDGAVLWHSLFPSMTFAREGSPILHVTPQYSPYSMAPRMVQTVTDENYLASPPYDARPSLERWITAGWGALPTSLPAQGPTPGNPWGVDGGRRSLGGVADDMYREFLTP